MHLHLVKVHRNCGRASFALSIGRSSITCPIPECRLLIGHRQLRAVLSIADFGRFVRRSVENLCLADPHLERISVQLHCVMSFDQPSRTLPVLRFPTFIHASLLRCLFMHGRTYSRQYEMAWQFRYARVSGKVLLQSLHCEGSNCCPA